MSGLRRHGLSVLVVTAILAGASSGQARDLVIGVNSETTSIDPHFYNTSANYNIYNHIFEFLVMKDHEEHPRPVLAESWRRIDDLTWELKLRRDVKWASGEPFTVDDVLFNVERGKSNEIRTTSPTTRFMIDKDYRRVDDHTLLVITKQPNPLLINEMTIAPMVSRKHGQGARTEDYNNGKVTVGTGPYRFVSWTPGDRVILERSPAWRGTPGEWDRIIYKPITADAPRVAALLAGDVDLINDVPVSFVSRIEQDPRFSITSVASNRFIYLHIDQYRPVSPFVKGIDGKPLDQNPLKNPKVRQALTLAINRAAIVDRLMEGQAKAAGQPAIPGMFGYVPDLPPPPFDVATARRLLAEAGYPNGFRLTVHGPNDRYVNDAKVVEAIAQMFARIGIPTEVQTEPKATYFARAKDYSVILIGYGSDTGEASSALTSVLMAPDRERNRGAVNRGGYANSAFDALVERALVEFDDRKREAMLQDATRIAMRDDFAIIPLYWQMNIWAHRKDLAMTPRVDERTYGFDVHSKR